MREIYLDNAAATLVDSRVSSAMARAATLVGNPSSFNDAGRRAAHALSVARRGVAKFLNAREDEVVFCASGSEANALALAGVGAILTEPAEHISVLRSAGSRAKFVSVNTHGMVLQEDIAAALDAKTRIVSVMYANNEIGTIQPIKSIAKVVRDWRKKHRSPYPYFHVDACQAAAYLTMDVQALGTDLVTFNGSKVYGPRGIAVLYVRRGVRLVPQILGGGQEWGLRAGTENIPAIIGLAKALSLIKKADAKKVAQLRDYFLECLPVVLPDAHINGPTGDDHLANNINISIPGTDSERLLLELDKLGIRAGAGSACMARAVESSHVLRAIGTPRKYLDGALRLSLSKHTTKAELDAVLLVLPAVVARVRALNVA